MNTWTVTLQGHVCRVAAYPISIEWPPRWLAQLPEVAITRSHVRQQFNIDDRVFLGLGVERWDFTKGILERFQAMEALFDKNTKLHGRGDAAAGAAPSRSQLPAYQHLQEQTIAEWSASTLDLRRQRGARSY